MQLTARMLSVVLPPFRNGRERRQLLMAGGLRAQPAFYPEAVPYDMHFQILSFHPQRPLGADPPATVYPSSAEKDFQAILLFV